MSRIHEGLKILGAILVFTLATLSIFLIILYGTKSSRENNEIVGKDAYCTNPPNPMYGTGIVVYQQGKYVVISGGYMIAPYREEDNSMVYQKKNCVFGSGKNVTYKADIIRYKEMTKFYQENGY